MKNTVIKHLLLIVGCLFFFAINSCKKQDLSNDLHTSNSTDGSIPFIIAPDQNIVVFATNATGTSALVDSSDNPVDIRSGQTTTFSQGQSRTQVLTSCVDGNGDPIYNFDAVLFSTYGTVVCGSGGGITFSVTFTVSTALPLVSTSSKGNIRLRNSAGTVFKTYAAVTTVTVTNIGSDPSFPGDTKYSVTYTCPTISVTDWNNTYIIDNSSTLHTTCTDPTNVGTGYQTSYSLYVNTVMGTPCTRVDLPHVGSTNVAGSNTTGSCATTFTGYQPPNYNQISWEAVSGGAITKVLDLESYGTRNIIVGTGTDNAFTIYIHAGTYNIRYRNEQDATHGNCYGPWSGYQMGAVY